MVNGANVKVLKVLGTLRFYNGFADTSSVEIEMSDGSYQTFMVNDEDLVNKLNDMDEGTKITFTYGAVEGQANMEILSIE